MPRFSVSIPEEQHDWLEDEADRRDRSKADIVRSCITAVQTGSVISEPDQTGAVRTDVVNDLEDRLAQLEERVDDLEYTPEPDPDPDPPRDLEPATPSSTPEPQSNGGETTIEEVVENWQPGRGVNERQPRREAGRAALEWLRENGGPASATVFQRELHDDYPVNDQNEKTWWRKSVRPALQEADDAGLVTYRPGHHDYVWNEE